jgi:hypothetical protein
MLGFVHCTAVLIDRLVENGMMERDEIDAALQSVEDRMFAEEIPGLDEVSTLFRLLSAPARILRAVNAAGRAGKVLSNSDIEKFLRGGA